MKNYLKIFKTSLAVCLIFCAFKNNAQVNIKHDKIIFPDETSQTSASGENIWKIVDNTGTDLAGKINQALATFKNVSLLPNTTYTIHNRININEEQNLHIPASCILKFDHTSSSFSAIHMSNKASLTGEGTLKLNRNDWNWSNQKAGVMITGCTNKIEFGTIEGFEYGFDLIANSAGVGWNNINVRYIYDCVIGIFMNKTGSGWINQNYFHVDNMGNHRTSSDPNDKAIWDAHSVGIYMYDYGNTNIFSGGVEGYNIGIRIMGKYNRMESLRLESCKTKILLEGTGGNSGTEYNYLYSPYGEIAGLQTPYGGETPIVNNTGYDLWKVLNVFGFDYITYVDELYQHGSHVFSDARLKKDINSIEGALNKVLALRGTTYNLKSDYKTDSTKNDKNDKKFSEYGFIAQELKEVLPELVEKNPLDGMYAINYNGVIPVLVEAFKEQQELIEQQENDIAELKELNNELIEILKEKGIIENKENEEFSEVPLLYQNNPNPFNAETEIYYNLPYQFKEAYILIMDMNGKLLERKDIHAKGKNKISIYANELNAGMYIYSLVCDGKVVGTKRMVLTE